MDRERIQQTIECIRHIHGWMQLIPEDLAEEFEAAYDDPEFSVENDLLEEMKQQWRLVDSVNYRKEIEEWKKEDPAFAKKARIRYLKARIRETLERFRDNRRQYVEIVREKSDPIGLLTDLLKKEADRLVKDLRRCEAMVDILNGKRKEEITPEMIERAREYPISQIVEVDRRGFARCLEHNERTPSMFTKGNFAHCFGCGYHADAIDLYRKISGATFPEAVKFLSGEL